MAINIVVRFFVLSFFIVILLNNARVHGENTTKNHSDKYTAKLHINRQFPLKRNEISKKSVYTDNGDYYILNTGERVNFLREKDKYLIVRKVQQPFLPKKSAAIFTKPNAKLGLPLNSTDFSNNYRYVEFELTETKDAAKALEDVTQTDPSVYFVSPILKNAKNHGTLAVLPQIIICFEKEANLDDMITQLKSHHVSFNRKLAFSNTEYEFKLDEDISDVGRIFEITRTISELKTVKWVEPNFVASPKKHFTPDDPLFSQQWYLHNTGTNGSLEDVDIDAPDAWELTQGDNTVIAIFDDGVETSHEDLNIWSNPGETGYGKESNGIDDDNNGYIDDYQGWDFEYDDNDPNPIASSDNHGTACAGVAGAIGNNMVGITGSMIRTSILPIRSGSMSCTQWGNAIRYAGKYADVVSNSWSISACYNEINSAIEDVVKGKIEGARRGNKGTALIFASGNSAGGWYRYTVSGFTPDTYTFHWKFTKDQNVTQGYDTVWLDEITWPGGTTTDFENSTMGTVPNGFISDGDATWSIVGDGLHAFGADSGKAVKAGDIGNNQETNLYTTKKVKSGTLVFWAWVSSEFEGDFMEFRVNDNLYFQYSPGQYSSHVNAVSYPASNSDTIAVGACTDGVGDLELRAAYSQFGPEIDIVAPSSGGAQDIITTDRTGTDGYNTNTIENGGNYCDDFGGTSSAAPLVAGIIAGIIENTPELNAKEIRDLLSDTAEKIGPYDYSVEGRNDYFGHGRVNLLNALQGDAQSIGFEDITSDSANNFGCYINLINQTALDSRTHHQ